MPSFAPMYITSLHKRVYFIRQKILTSDDNEYVGHEGGTAKLGEITDHRQGKKDNELGEDNVAARNVCSTISHSHDESLQILGDKDGICCAKASISWYNDIER